MELVRQRLLIEAFDRAPNAKFGLTVNHATEFRLVGCLCRNPSIDVTTHGDRVVASQRLLKFKSILGETVGHETRKIL